MGLVQMDSFDQSKSHWRYACLPISIEVVEKSKLTAGGCGEKLWGVRLGKERSKN